MPTVQMPNGQTAEFPDGMAPADIQAALTTHSQGQAAPATPAKAPGLMDKIGANWDSIMAPSSDDEGGVERVAHRTMRDIGDMVAHPIDSIKSGLQQSFGTQDGLDYTPPPSILAPYQGHGLAHGIEDAAGDAAALGITGKVGDAAGPVVADALHGTGGLMRKVGAGVDNAVIGTKAADMAHDTNPGAGLSRGRVIGTTKQGLADKVAARIDPLTQARDSQLAANQSGPQDVTGPVNQPFNDITTSKTNPRTGAVQPVAQGRMVRAQRAINEVQDPMTGAPSGTPKQLTDLSPQEVGQLQSNVYGMTNYEVPSDDIENQGIKGAGANLRDLLLQIAPEAVDTTSLLHDTLGANDVLRGQLSGEHSVPTTLRDLINRGTTGVGTTAGAALDAGGSGLQNLAGRIRTAISPAPGAQSAPQGGGSPQPGVVPPPPTLPAAQGGASGQVGAGGGLERVPPPVEGQPGAVPQGPPPPPQQLPPNMHPTQMLAAKQAAARLPADTSGYGATNQPNPQTPPPLNEGTAATRVKPTLFNKVEGLPSPSQINVTPEGQGIPTMLPDKQLPATTAPGKRIGTLFKGWDKEAASQAANLQDKVAADSLDHSTMTDHPTPDKTDSSQGSTLMGTAAPKTSGPTGSLMAKVQGEVMKENADATGPEMGGTGSKAVEPSVPVGAGSLIEPMDVYHGTKKGLWSKIQSEGLKPQTRSKANGSYDDARTYLTPDPGNAMSYSGKGGAVVQTTLPPKTPVTFDTTGIGPNGYGINGIKDLYVGHDIPADNVKPVSGNVNQDFKNPKQWAAPPVSLMNKIGAADSGAGSLKEQLDGIKNQQDMFRNNTAPIGKNGKPMWFDDDPRPGRGGWAEDLGEEDDPEIPGYRPSEMADILMKGPNVKTLAQKVGVSPSPKVGPKLVTKGLPGPRDIDGWEQLVDEGKAKYNTATHQYDYLGNNGGDSQRHGGIGAINEDDAKSLLSKVGANKPSDKVRPNINPKNVEVGDHSLIADTDYYHGTNSLDVPSILKKGLIDRSGGYQGEPEFGVKLTPDRSLADKYGQRAVTGVNEYGDSDPTGNHKYDDNGDPIPRGGDPAVIKATIPAGSLMRGDWEHEGDINQSVVYPKKKVPADRLSLMDKIGLDKLVRSLK